MLTFITVVCSFYGLLMFFDYFFKSCMMLPYIEFLASTGISVKFFRLQFHTTKVNRTVVRMSNKLPWIYRNSFKLGCYTAMVLFPIALLIVLASLFSASISKENTGNQVASSGDVARLEILLPGVNLPLNEIGFYIISLLICSVVHEAGHGIAAVLEDVPVSGFGLMFLFVIPVAYTEIDIDQLQSTKLMKKLKIFTAGIWNNLLLAAFAYVLLLSLPVLMTPVYDTNKSVFVTKIRPDAPVRGEKGLYTGDSVIEINGCRVTSEDRWTECLVRSIRSHPAYCLTDDFVTKNEESMHEIEHLKDGTVSCCPSNPALNCFESFDHERLPQYVCLNIRKTVEHSENYCDGHNCPEHFSCLKPVLSNSSTIIHVKRKNRSIDMIYFGHPYDFLQYVEVSEFTPKTKIFEPWFADAIKLLLKYLAVFSSGLALVNVLPCYGLDGQFLVNSLIADLPNLSKGKKELISNSINLVGSLTLFVAVIKIFYRSLQ